MPDTKKTQGLDLGDWKSTFKTYFDPKKGRELRAMHQKVSNQYSNRLYGWTVVSFGACAGLAYMISRVIAREPPKEG